MLSQIKKWDIDSYWKLSNGNPKIFIKLASNFLHKRNIFVSVQERTEALDYIYEKYGIKF